MPNTAKSSLVEGAKGLVANFAIPKKGQTKDEAKKEFEANNPTAKEKAAATKRRNLISKAVETIKGLSDEVERDFVREAFSKDGWAEGPDADWLVGVFAPSEEPAAGNNQPKPRPKTDGSVLCPVSGNPIDTRGSKPKAFSGFGNDAKAKSIINALLQPEVMPSHKRAKQILKEEWHNPAAAYAVVELCKQRKITAVTHVRDLFVEAMVDAAMAEEAKADAKA